MSVLVSRVTAEGQQLNFARELPLRRSEFTTVGFWPMTLMSFIDGEEDHPPDFIHSQRDVEEARVDLAIAIKGSDNVQQQDVFGNKEYTHKQIRVGCHLSATPLETS